MRLMILKLHRVCLTQRYESGIDLLIYLSERKEEKENIF